MPGESWTVEQVAELQEKHSDAKRRVRQRAIAYADIPNVIEIEGKSANAIRAKLRRLKLWKPQFTKQRWTEEEDRELSERAKPGVGAKRHKRLRRHSKTAIANRKTELARAGQQLVDAEISARSKNATKLRGEDLAEFEEAIKKFARTRPADWFLWKFGVSDRSYRERRQSLGVEISKAESLEIPCGKAQLSRKQTVRLLLRGQASRRQLRASMLAERSRIDSLDEKPEVRFCANKPCAAEASGRWYATEAFFKLRSHSSKGYALTRSLSGECAFCITRKRVASGRDAFAELARFHAMKEASLKAFAEQLSAAYPGAHGDQNAFKLMRKELEAYLLDLPRISLHWGAQKIVSAYTQDPNLNTLFLWMEASDFAGATDLHDDVWDLDQLLRKHQDPSDFIAGGSVRAFSPSGRKLALLVFRCLSIVKYIEGVF